MPFSKGNQFGTNNKGRRITWTQKISEGLKRAYKEGRIKGFKKGHLFLGDLSKPNYFQKGVSPWNTGKKTGIVPANAKPIVIKRCRYCLKEFKVRGSGYKRQFCVMECRNKYFRGERGSFYGRHPSKEHIEKLSRLFRGPGGPNWRGGTSSIHKRLRHSLRFKRWREAVFKRDDYRCQFCGVRSMKGNRVELHPDHIKPFALYPKLRFEVTNGRTLCAPCHRKTPTWGLVHRKDCV
ncbi:MAG: HNH endonuclease [Candidatus Wildermuthbacteria bacterium]|nr:HNH endonuclease [Candidatus Wildermuthbacteria bacterium]